MHRPFLVLGPNRRRRVTAASPIEALNRVVGLQNRGKTIHVTLGDIHDWWVYDFTEDDSTSSYLVIDTYVASSNVIPTNQNYVLHGEYSGVYHRVLASFDTSNIYSMVGYMLDTEPAARFLADQLFMVGYNVFTTLVEPDELLPKLKKLVDSNHKTMHIQNDRSTIER